MLFSGGTVRWESGALLLEACALAHDLIRSVKLESSEGSPIDMCNSEGGLRMQGKQPNGHARADILVSRCQGRAAKICAAEPHDASDMGWL